VSRLRFGCRSLVSWKPAPLAALTEADPTSRHWQPGRLARTQRLAGLFANSPSQPSYKKCDGGVKRHRQSRNSNDWSGEKSVLSREPEKCGDPVEIQTDDGGRAIRNSRNGESHRSNIWRILLRGTGWLWRSGAASRSLPKSWSLVDRLLRSKPGASRRVLAQFQ
jgi:hypothetical protein